MVELYWSEALVTPVLIIATILLSPLPSYILTNVRIGGGRGKKGQDDLMGNQTADQKTNPNAFIIPSQIHHARMLPKESRHSFRYPSLYYAFELQELERGNCDCSIGFQWSTNLKKSWSLTKFHPKDFGRKIFTGVQSNQVTELLTNSIFLKLMYELRFRGYISFGPQDLKEEEELNTNRTPWDKEVGQVWAIAMPTVFGLAGFNPLTVYYVYRPSEAGDSTKRGSFWMAILEVHNTFNERHIYVCEVGKGEDDSGKSSIRQGYDHSWIFARDFHVSPFNDRSGYYQLFIRDLWSNSPNNELPTIDIRLLLLVSGEKDEMTTSVPLQKKLLATLTSSQSTSATQKPKRHAKPLHTLNIFSMIARQPFDLFLPVARIMWEAAKIHWKKNLPVYIRPEPKGEAKGWRQDEGKRKDLSSSFDGIGWPNVHNPVESGETNRLEKNEIRERASGNIYWNDESFMEKVCRNQIEKYLCFLSSSINGKSIEIKNKNAEMKDKKFENGQMIEINKQDQDINKTNLIFYTMSSALFLDLCLYVPEHALLFGSQVERGWGVNSIERFKTFFASDTATSKSTRSIRIAKWLRTSYLQWALKETLESDKTEQRKEREMIANQLLLQSSSNHFLDFFDYPWTLLLALALHIYSLKIMAKASKLLNVRYVRHPWAQVGEGLAILTTKSQLNE